VGSPWIVGEPCVVVVSSLQAPGMQLVWTDVSQKPSHCGGAFWAGVYYIAARLLG